MKKSVFKKRFITSIILIILILILILLHIIPHFRFINQENFKNIQSKSYNLVFLRSHKNRDSFECDKNQLWGPDIDAEYILDLLSEKDIVVTNDILLAHECIKKFASVLKYSGEILNKTNIANEVSKRNLMTEIRSSDPFHLSKSKPFLKKYKSNF